jgi:hypothetical protein
MKIPLRFRFLLTMVAGIVVLGGVLLLPVRRLPGQMQLVAPHLATPQTHDVSVTVYENAKSIAVDDPATSRRLQQAAEEVLTSTNDGLYDIVGADMIADVKRGLAVEVDYSTPRRFTTALGPIEIGGMLVSLYDYDGSGKVFVSTVYLRSWGNEVYESGPRTTHDTGKVGHLRALLTTPQF